MNVEGRFLLAATLAVASMAFASNQLWREASSAIAPAGTVLVRVQKLTGLDAANREQVLCQSERGMLVPLHDLAQIGTRLDTRRQRIPDGTYRDLKIELANGFPCPARMAAPSTHSSSLRAMPRCCACRARSWWKTARRAPARSRSIRHTRPRAGAAIPWLGMTTSAKGASSSANCAGTAPSSTRTNETGRLVGRSWRSRVRWRRSSGIPAQPCFRPHGRARYFSIRYCWKRQPP